jgi:D-alanine-D-alanine ligase-like ATP-grasp enzyme
LLEHKSLDSLKEKTKALMKEFKLKYGRLDFIEENDSFYFLECNPNGQFGWLDDFNTLHLHNKFVDSFLKN